MKKQQQLGMNPSTASGRLVKDILFKLVTDAGHTCFQCGNSMTRDNFSIEHKIPWIDSNNPVELYFDLNNIAFSHLKCNIGARRSTNLAECGTRSKYKSGCRCLDCKSANAANYRNNYSPDIRRNRYKRTGN